MLYQHRQTKDIFDAEYCTPDTKNKLERVSGRTVEIGQYLINGNFVFVVMDSDDFHERFRPYQEQRELF